jgi:hypothetical protein
MKNIMLDIVTDIKFSKIKAKNDPNCFDLIHKNGNYFFAMIS